MWFLLFRHDFWCQNNSLLIFQRADLRVVGVTGLGPSANLLRPHPVALHWGIMCNRVKVHFRPFFSKLSTNKHKLWARWWEASAEFKPAMSQKRQQPHHFNFFYSLASFLYWNHNVKGYIWPPWAPWWSARTVWSSHSLPAPPASTGCSLVSAAPQTSWNEQTHTSQKMWRTSHCFFLHRNTLLYTWHMIWGKE